MTGTSHSGAGVKALISRILPYAQVTMLASVVIRSLATVVSTLIPYHTWPLVVQLAVEVVAVLGMIVCAEIILSAAAASWAVIQHQIKSTEASDDYKPSPRLKGDALTRMADLLDKRKAEAVKRLAGEAHQEVTAMKVGGGITIAYGLLFALTTINTVSLTTIATELLLCCTLPYIVFYFSARYKPDQKDPAETAQAATVEALDQQVKDAGARILSGVYDRRHVGLLEAAAPDTPVHKKMLAALAPVDALVEEMTVPDVYKWLGTPDKTERASIRRVVRKAGERKTTDPEGELLVRWDEREEEWRVRKRGLPYLFAPERWQASRERTTANTPRTGGEQGANTPRTLHIPRGAAKEAQQTAETPVA